MKSTVGRPERGPDGRFHAFPSSLRYGRERTGAFSTAREYPPAQTYSSHYGSVAIIVRLVRPIDWDAEIVGLLRREFRELDAELVEVQPRDLFVHPLGQYVNANREFFR